MAFSPAKSGHGSPVRLGRSSLSTQSLGSPMSLRTGGGSPCASPPPSAAHGTVGCGQRRFGSRHVPKLAEKVLANEEATAGMVKRLTGLMKHLRSNSSLDDFQKEVLATDEGDRLVPEELDERLRAEFERLCAYGERMNLEAMSSAKWVKMLRDIGAIAPDAGAAPLHTMTKEQADVIFYKVVHNCDHGGHRLLYSMFCKAVCIASVLLRPEIEDWEAAMNELLAQVLGAAPGQAESPVKAPQSQATLMDTQVALMLAHFRPALHNIFNGYCRRNLNNPASPTHGPGKVRASERAAWKVTQEQPSSSCSSPVRRHSLGGLMGTSAAAPAAVDFGMGKDVPLSSDDATLNCTGYGDCGATSPEAPPGPGGAGAGESAGTGSAGGLAPLPIETKLAQAPLETILSPSKASQYDIYTELAGVSPKAARFSLSTASGSPKARTSLVGSPKSVNLGEDPYIYAGGSPVCRGRQQYMSFDQVHTLCKELKIVPDLLTRVEMTRIYKHNQSVSSPSKRAGTTQGLLTKEAFVDMVAQMGLEAYAKEPLCDEYPEAHEKLHSFLSGCLPKSTLKSNDRYLYGCRSKP